jgi:hypothetical protein
MGAYKYSIFYYNIDSFRFMTLFFRKWKVEDRVKMFLGDFHWFAGVVF